MTRNVTLRLDETIVRQCRHIAVEENKSFSQWVVDTLTKSLFQRKKLVTARRKALERLDKGLDLGGTPFNREEAHER